MLTNNKKLTKEFKNIIASMTNAKNLAIQELDKIDAKYKALAEKEKTELSKTVKLLETQLAAYASLTEEETTEPTITDTIFPENNASGEKETNEVEQLAPLPEEITINLDESAAEEITEAFEEENTPVIEDVWNNSSEAETETSSEESSNEVTSTEEDEWPEQPEEWNV